MAIAATGRAWATDTPIGALADQYHLLVVCPDGENSWYFDSPENPRSKFETFVSGELVSFIDGHYRTIPNRAGRATLGLSMGGHGALFLAIRHQGVFGAAASMSGGVDIRPFPKQWENQQGARNHRSPSRALEGILGRHAGEGAERWRPRGFPWTAGCRISFSRVNRALHEELIGQHIAHDYAERPARTTGTIGEIPCPTRCCFWPASSKRRGVAQAGH